MTSVALGDVAEINPRLPERPSDDETVSFLPMSQLMSDGSTTRGEDRSFGEVARGYTQFCDGDLLVAKITPCFQNNKIGQAALTRRFGVGSTEFHVVRPQGDRLDTRYLLHFMRRDQIRGEGERRMTGSGGQRRVPADFLRQLHVPLPPIEEQRRIAAILDQSDSIKRLALAPLDALTDGAARLLEIMLMRSSFERRPLSDLADIASGLTKGRTLTGEATQRVPYLAVANVQAGHLRLEAIKTIEATPQEIRRFSLLPGDLVLTEGGNPDKLGRGTVWRGEAPLMLHQNHIFRVRVREGPSGVSPDYLSAFLSGREARSYFLRSAKQTTGIASINKRQLSAIPVPIPSQDARRAFELEYRAFNDQRQMATARLNSISKMGAALNARAFCGQL